MRRCSLASTRTASRCWWCGWRRRCSRPASHRLGSQTHRRQTFPVRFSGQCVFFSSLIFLMYIFSHVCLLFQLLPRAESESTSGGWRRSWRSLHYCAEGSTAQSTPPSTELGHRSLEHATVQTAQNQTITRSQAAPSMTTPWSDCNNKTRPPRSHNERARHWSKRQIVNPRRL